MNRMNWRESLSPRLPIMMADIVAMNSPSLRSVCHLAVGLLIVALAMRTWLVMGLIVPVTVSGSSMAPTLWGPHRAYVCPECEHRFAVGLDQLSGGAAELCPECGRESPPDGQSQLHRGHHLIVDRTAYWWRAPWRGEVVVFRCPEQADQLCVKRVVGLPGETVKLADGDVLVDGRLVAPLDPRPGDRVGQWRLGPGELYVVGDNATISDDSRSWVSSLGLDAKLLIGKPLGVR